MVVWKLATWPVACTPASVRPAAQGAHRMVGHLRQRRFQLALHRRLMALALPAVEGAAVVLDANGNLRGHQDGAGCDGPLCQPFKQGLGLAALLVGAAGHHFLEHFPGAGLVVEVDVGLGQVQLDRPIADGGAKVVVGGIGRLGAASASAAAQGNQPDGDEPRGGQEPGQGRHAPTSQRLLPVLPRLAVSCPQGCQLAAQAGDLLVPPLQLAALFANLPTGLLQQIGQRRRRRRIRYPDRVRWRFGGGLGWGAVFSRVQNPKLATAPGPPKRRSAGWLRRWPPGAKGRCSPRLPANAGWRPPPSR